MDASIRKVQQGDANALAYLDWFFTVNEKQNAQIFEEARIYHFQILTEDTILDVLSDAFPVIQPIDQTDACC